MKVWVATFEVYLEWCETPVEQDIQMFTTEKLANDYLDDMEQQAKQLYEDEESYSYIPYLSLREIINKPTTLNILGF